MEPLRSGDPRRISSYEILNRLGAGGMGQVYLARSPSGRRVAVKVIRPELTNDPTFRHRFRREVTAMRQVSGFFTAPVVDADPDGDPAWLATAFVPGPSLESAIADGGAMPHQDVLLLAAGLAEALNAIHREGLTHRDLKPGNVLMAEDGPRVIDFGLAVAAGSSTANLTQAGTVVGTPAFMSPEQVSGQPVGPASDVWSLGAVLAYAATGASPFGDGGTLETMMRVMNGEPDLSGLTGTLAQLVSACMMRDPNTRPTPARILRVLSEGAGVLPTMAMEVQPPVAVEGQPSVAVQVQPPVAAQVQPPVAVQDSGAAGAWAADARVESGSNPSAPVWGTAPSQPAAPVWGSGSGSSPVVPSQPSAPAWGTVPSQPAAPVWGSGPAAAPPQPAPPQPMPPTQPNQWQPQPPTPTYPYQGTLPTQASQPATPWIQPAPPYSFPLPPPEPVKKNRNALIAALSVAAVVVIGGGVAVLTSGGGSGGSGGSSGGSTGGTSGGTLGGSGGIGAVTPIAADFPLSSLVTDADAAQYLHATPTAQPPTEDTTDDPATFDKDWLVDSAGTELRVQASNYKSDSRQAEGDFLDHTSTLATDAKFQDEGALGNSDKTEIQVSTDQSSGLQHCKVEVLRGGLDVTVTFVESGSAATAQTDVLNLAELVTGRLPAK